MVVANAPESGDTYGLYETIVFTVSFSEPVRAWGRLGLEVELDDPGGGSGSTVEAVFSHITKSQYPTDDTPQISRARHMHFEYKVKLFDRDVDGVSIGANALPVPSGARILNGEVGGDARLDHAAVGPLSDHKVDGSADVPVIERIEVVSTPRLRWRGSTTPDTYGEGENIRIEVRFDQPVQVEGEPTMALEVGDPCGSVCEARYESGSGTDTLVFAYLVPEVDLDRNGIAICTKGENRRQLSNTPSATVAGPADDGPERNTPATGAPAIGGTPRVGEELTASTSDISDADGLDDARFAYQWIRANSAISGATGSAYTAVEADEGERLKVRVSFTDDAGNAESLTSASNDAVAARPVPLTAEFVDMPAEHRGEGGFTFRVAFSEDIGISFRSLREDAFTVTGGRVTSGKRVDGRRDLFRMVVRPDSDGDVTITLPAGRECGVSGAICTKGENRRQLTNSPSATVRGPVGIAVSDAHVEEDAGAVLAFAVTLSRAASRALTVDYATSDGSAQAGVDYTAASGTLTFQERLQAPREPGFRGRFAGRELRRGMERDMALNFLRQLGGASGVHPAGMAGHTAMAGSPAAGAAPMGTPGRGGGGALMMGGGGPMPGAAGMAGGAASLHTPGLGAAGFGGAAPLGAGPAGGPPGLDGGLNGGGFLQMGLGGGDLLTGSDFAMNRESRGGILSFWSRGAQSRFSGREGALSLGGDVRTTMFGADYARGPVVAGLSLSNSRGLGEYAGVAGGQVASSVTGLYPWLGYKMTERVTVWGVAGYGTGGLLLTPDSGQALESGLSMAMAAAGTRGALVAGGASGFELAFKADALWVGTAIDGVDGPAGRLKATDAAVTRFRTGLEGSRAYTLGGRLSLTPSVEVGLRHDGGDAETGAGMDVGAGLIVSDAGTGLAVDVRVADAAGAPGRELLRAGRGRVSELQPDAVDAAGLYGAGGAVVGRAGDERDRGAVGPRDDGGHGARRRRAGQPPRWRGWLRAAGGQPLRRHAAGRLQHLGVRAGLSGRLRPRRARPREHELRARGRGAAPQQSGARGPEQRAARAGHAGLVRNAQPFGCYRPGCARERALVSRVDAAVPGAVRAPRLAAPHPPSGRRGPQHRGAGTAGRRRLDGVGRGGDAGGRRVSGARACGSAWARAIA